MTWRELKNFINKKARDRKEFLDTDVSLYDFKTGDEYTVNTTELLGESDEEDDSNWIPYLSINEEEETTNETETKETSID